MKNLSLKNISILVILTACLGLEAGSAHAQKTFSESLGYRAREIPYPKTRSKKKKEKGVVPEAVEPNVAGKTRTIPVSVFDRDDKPVTDLKPSDFTIFIDGKEAAISSVADYADALNIIMLVDSSPSTIYSAKEIQEMATTILGGLDPRDKVTIISFNSKTKLLADSTSDQDKIKKAVDKLSTGDGTSLYEAIRYTLGNVANGMPGRTAVLLLTDGVDTTSVISYENSLLYAQKSEAALFPVYFDTLKDIQKNSSKSLPPMLATAIMVSNPRFARISPNFEKEYAIGLMYLDDLTLISGGRAFRSSDIGKKRDLKMRDNLKPMYLLSVAAPPGTSGQTPEIRVRVNRPDLVVMARGSYLVEKEDKK